MVFETCDNYDSYNGYYNCNSSWDRWGRWVLAGALLFFFIFAAILLSFMRTRRRRRLGLAPMYGGGWGRSQPAYGAPNPNQPYYNAAAPPYSAPVGLQQTGNTFNSNEGYYGPQTELQPPANTYAPQRGGEPVYGAPPGPPPAKGQTDGVIR